MPDGPPGSKMAAKPESKPKPLCVYIYITAGKDKATAKSRERERERETERISGLPAEMVVLAGKQRGRQSRVN